MFQFFTICLMPQLRSRAVSGAQCLTPGPKKIQAMPLYATTPLLRHYATTPLRHYYATIVTFVFFTCLTVLFNLSQHIQLISTYFVISIFFNIDALLHSFYFLFYRSFSIDWNNRNFTEQLGLALFQ